MAQQLDEIEESPEKWLVPPAYLRGACGDLGSQLSGYLELGDHCLKLAHADDRRLLLRVRGPGSWTTLCFDQILGFL